MSKSTAGLRKRGRYWWIEKTVSGIKLYESTGETELEQAELYLAMRVQQIRSVLVYGDKLERTFDTAAARYIEEYEHKRSLDRDITTLKAVVPFIGDMPLRQVHNGTLESYIKARKATGISAGTLNRDMAVIRRILNLSAKLWRDDQGRPWLDTVPMLPIIQGAKRKPRPISQAEEQRIIKGLPQYLADMVLFALHTGLRDQELCGLKWDHEMKITGTVHH